MEPVGERNHSLQSNKFVRRPVKEEKEEEEDGENRGLTNLGV